MSREIEQLVSDEEDYEYEEDDNEGDDVKDVDRFPLPPVALDEDTFGMTVCSLVRDSYFISKHGLTANRCTRLAATLFLVSLTIIIQVFLLQKVKQFVCARSVHDIRVDYDEFEKHMYTKEHCTLTVNGKHRGIDGFFPSPMSAAVARLNEMPFDDVDKICRIPLSQPYFFGMVLLIWTLTCISELRKCFHMELVIVMLPTVDSMSKSMRAGDDDASDVDAVIEGMTVGMKVGLTVLTFIPRLCVTLYLLWVGCRWLLATNAFADLILNAVALEFILLIKDTVYASLMPTRSGHDLEVTAIVPYPSHMTSDWWNFANTLSLLVIACIWVYCYMVHWQQVLPNYNWDVHDVCEKFIQERYSV